LDHGSTVENTLRDNLGDFSRDSRVILLSLMAVGIGIISALIAYALVWLIGLITNLSFYQRVSAEFTSPANNHLGLLVIIPPVIGGLIIGLMARYGSEQIRGHGIPEALEAILIGRSRIGLKVALLKPLSSALSIGTGGPFGAEGPIIMTGGAFGSLFAQAFNLSTAERKTLLVAGAAGGMAAIFATPVAAVLLAVELLLFEWKPRSFIPVAFASITAALLRVFLMGNGPIFGIPPHPQLSGVEVIYALAVGIVAGLGSSVLTILVYAFEDWFRKLPIHWMWWPIIGGLFVGLGGIISPQSLGVGYDTIRSLLAGHVVVTALIILLVVKTLIWSLALGSGTSGGVLAPLMIIGGALGALEGHFIPAGDVGLWVLISMAAMMGGTMRAPFTAMVFALELTHDLNVLPALLVACVAADAVTVLLMRRSILTEKVARRGHHLTREYSVDPLELIRVREVMDPRPEIIPPTMTLSEFADEFMFANRIVKHQGFLVADAPDKLIGIFTKSDVVNHLMKQDLEPDASIVEICDRNPVVTYADELLSQATTKMLRRKVGRLPVVDRQDQRKLVGYLGRTEVLEARKQVLYEEYVRERGWLRQESIESPN
jgi:H+/Cl- antiporter ClcA/CBS domain-containing protein